MGEREAIVRFIDDLAHKNSEALSFIPRPRLEQYADRGQILLARENDEPAGFLVFGRGWPETRIYQACTQYDARRRQLGLDLVERLAERATADSALCVRLWCADDLDANAFWASAGFVPVRKRAGGRRRGRVHTLWVRDLGTGLFALPAAREPDHA